MDGARRLYARQLGMEFEHVAISTVIRNLRDHGRQDLAGRLQKAYKARRITAHPDELLVWNLGICSVTQQGC